jgi:hypothetical protein
MIREWPPQCHHAVTHNLAKLTEQLFVAGTMVPGLASNCSTLELLNVRNADRLSARDALRVDRGDTGGAGRLPAIKIIQLIQGNESHASSNIEGRGRFEREPPAGAVTRGGRRLARGRHHGSRAEHGYRRL